MKYYEPNQEEKELLESYENDEWESVPDKEVKMETFRMAAHNTLSRNKSINIRITERDLLKIKAKAAHEGIPYQTLITSVLHKYSNQA